VVEVAVAAHDGLESFGSMESRIHLEDYGQTGGDTRPYFDRSLRVPVSAAGSGLPRRPHESSPLAEVARLARRDEVALGRLAPGRDGDDVVGVEHDTLVAAALAAVQAPEAVALEDAEPEARGDGRTGPR